MTKAAKKIKRRMKKLKEKQVQKDIKEKVGMFSKLEDLCLICQKPFDKQNKKMVQSWYVVVRETQGKVNLYCPECWNRANDMVEKVKEEMNAKKS